jgi:membrane associated rhomboid family serine protease
MRLNGLSYIILILIGILLFIPIFMYESVYCTISNAGAKGLNGFYTGLGGEYLKRGYPVLLYPDYFELLNIRRELSSYSSLGIKEGQWQILSNYKRSLEYSVDQGENIDAPPKLGWQVAKDGHAPAPMLQCHGSLQSAPDIPNYSRESNLQSLYHRPVNLMILIIIFYIFFLCVTNQIDINSVVISYDSIINRDEYWRIFSASLSHFDWMHIIFNAMSLYQIGDLEIVLGSGTYLYLSIDLIVITMIICLMMEHILITRMNRTDMIHQQSVGYSCVLFAWMVVFSVRLKKFCPIFLFPSLCFSTYFIKLPGVPGTGFPVNFGPIVLLIFTKVIIPQSSFLGHLSGILIGYPLAWSLMNWLTPPLLLALITVAVIYKSNMIINNLNIFELARTTENFHEIIPSLQYLWLNILTIASIIYVPVALMILFCFGWKQSLFRGSLIYLLWNAVYAIRCYWLCDQLQSTTIKACGDIIFFSALITLFSSLLDAATLVGLLCHQQLLTSVVSVSAYIPCIVPIILSLIVLVLDVIISVGLWYGMRDNRSCAAWLEALRVDPMSVDHDMQNLGIKYLGGAYNRMQDAFSRSRIGRRLGHSRLPLEDPEMHVGTISRPSQATPDRSENKTPVVML